MTPLNNKLLINNSFHQEDDKVSKETKSNSLIKNQKYQHLHHYCSLPAFSSNDKPKTGLEHKHLGARAAYLKLKKQEEQQQRNIRLHIDQLKIMQEQAKVITDICRNIPEVPTSLLSLYHLPDLFQYLSERKEELKNKLAGLEEEKSVLLKEKEKLGKQCPDRFFNLLCCPFTGRWLTDAVLVKTLEEFFIMSAFTLGKKIEQGKIVDEPQAFVCEQVEKLLKNILEITPSYKLQEIIEIVKRGENPLTEETLSDGILFEKFTQPVLLPCGHTLDDKTIFQLRLQNQYEFCCPFCRENLEIEQGVIDSITKNLAENYDSFEVFADAKGLSLLKKINENAQEFLRLKSSYDLVEKVQSQFSKMIYELFLSDSSSVFVPSQSCELLVKKFINPYKLLEKTVWEERQNLLKQKE